MNLADMIPIVAIVVAFGVLAAVVVRDDRFAARRRTALRIEVIKGDITTVKVDAIVNAAKSSLLGGGGVDGAIHRAGGPAILEECKSWRERLPVHGLRPGLAVHTTAGNLPAQWVIHTVGPRFHPAEYRADTLRNCYTSALKVADELGARTVAFPLISAGVYGWPMGDAIIQAINALRAADTRVETATLVLFDEQAYQYARTVLRLG